MNSVESSPIPGPSPNRGVIHPKSSTEKGLIIKGLSQKQTALFPSPTNGCFSCLFWDRAFIFGPLPAIFSHFGLSQKKNVDFWDSPFIYGRFLNELSTFI